MSGWTNGYRVDRHLDGWKDGHTVGWMDGQKLKTDRLQLSAQIKPKGEAISADIQAPKHKIIV